ncbi:MAG: L-aspartate oxidase [Nanoarchaeota archaeon]|nr:L-aspartate oxidase [Nanoarchaeota archaeon]MCG2717562.1 L-aspartate oxidase [Nanoarchaeota archaeon]
MKTDFVVIGSGIAGLNFALEASKYGKVTLITKKEIMDSNTNKAQGGIAAVLDRHDSTESHVEDTLKTGCYHNDIEAVEYLVKEGPKMIKKLLDYGTPFEQKSGVLKLTREGGHKCRRVAYSGDHTGHAIEKTLVDVVKENENIEVLEDTMALDLIVKDGKCYGVQYLQGKKVGELYGKAVILATGGAGYLFAKTTNPDIATADGLAMAARAGAKIEDMEFLQFHPTALSKNGHDPFLISEAVRGEGGKLKNSKGKRFMHKYHEMKELAPRDIVARAIAKEALNGPVTLDISHEDSEFLKTRFPTIYETLIEIGIDMTKEPIPVSPAAHYTCGGVKVNLDGETNIGNLYAFGEVSRTGVHGANRLASNSLLESIVFSNNIIKAVKNLEHEVEEVPVEKQEFSDFDAANLKKEIRQIMWDHVGLIRNEKGLKTSIQKLRSIEENLPKGVNKDLIEAKNMAIAGRIIAEAALKRKKSLGCHFRDDEI